MQNDKTGKERIGKTDETKTNQIITLNLKNSVRYRQSCIQWILFIAWTNTVRDFGPNTYHKADVYQ